MYGKQTVGTINYCEQYVVQYLKQILKKHTGREFCHPAVEILKEYDQKHNSNLLLTLKLFFLNERDYRLTAENMYVHRNTIQHRIDSPPITDPRVALK